jgi:hypothetical protein
MRSGGQVQMYDVGLGDYELRTTARHEGPDFALAYANVERCTSDAAGPSLLATVESVTHQSTIVVAVTATSYAGPYPSSVVECVARGPEEGPLEVIIARIKNGLTSFGHQRGGTDPAIVMALPVEAAPALRITSSECVASGRPPLELTLDRRGLESMLATVLPDGDAVTYLLLQGPPGGPLSATIAVASPSTDLEAVVRSRVYPAFGKELSFGARQRVLVLGRERDAIAFEAPGDAEWRPTPGGALVRLGAVDLLLEAEGFERDVLRVLAHPVLSKVVSGLSLLEA